MGDYIAMVSALVGREQNWLAALQGLKAGIQVRHFVAHFRGVLGSSGRCRQACISYRTVDGFASKHLQDQD